MKTNVYVDGFNLYYGMFRWPRYLPWKWCNLRGLAESLLPTDTIHRVRYFSAIPEAPAHDPDRPIRQMTYFRALQTLPGFSLHLGKYQTTMKRGQWVAQPIDIPELCPPVDPSALPELRRAFAGLDRINVWNNEEKGSDVNLATWMLLDAFEQDCEQVLLISNDSDLAVPVKVIRDKFKIPIIVYNPRSSFHSVELRRACTQHRMLRPGYLKRNLLDDPVIDAAGNVINQPQQWADAVANWQETTP